MTEQEDRRDAAWLEWDGQKGLMDEQCQEYEAWCAAWDAGRRDLLAEQQRAHNAMIERIQR